MNLVGVMLDAPIMGVLVRWPHRLHAVDMEAVCDGWDRGTFRSVCGFRGLKLVGADTEPDPIAAPWPPRLRGLPDGYERCRTCWEGTGKMRPRIQWRRRATDDV